MAHIRGTHLALKQYHCDPCQQGFKWYMQLHRHRKRFHPEMFPEEAAAGGGPAEMYSDDQPAPTDDDQETYDEYKQAQF